MESIALKVFVLLENILNSYKQIFKAAIVLSTFYIIALAQFFVLILPVEEKYVSNKASLEYSLQKKINDISEYTCEVTLREYQKCELAKQQYRISRSSTHLFSVVQQLLTPIISLLFLISLIGFLFREKRSVVLNSVNEKNGS